MLGPSFALPENITIEQSNITDLHFQSLAGEDMRIIFGWAQSLKKLPCYTPGVPDFCFVVLIWDEYNGPTVVIST